MVGLQLLTALITLEVQSLILATHLEGSGLTKPAQWLERMHSTAEIQGTVMIVLHGLSHLDPGKDKAGGSAIMDGMTSVQITVRRASRVHRYWKRYYPT